MTRIRRGSVSTMAVVWALCLGGAAGALSCGGSGEGAGDSDKHRGDDKAGVPDPPAADGDKDMKPAGETGSASAAPSAMAAPVDATKSADPAAKPAPGEGPGPASVSVSLKDGEVTVAVIGLPALSNDGKRLAATTSLEVPSGADNLRLYVFDAEKGTVLADEVVLSADDVEKAVSAADSKTASEALVKKVAPAFEKANALLADATWIPLRAAAADKSHVFTLDGLKVELSGKNVKVIGAKAPVDKSLKWPKLAKGCGGGEYLREVHVGGTPRTALVTVSFSAGDTCVNGDALFVLRVPE
jgi:hypothetical protein